MYSLRLARPDDAEALLEIYAQSIPTPATFEYSLPSPEEFRSRISDVLEFYPYLVCEADGVPAGYAYAHRYHQRPAYQWSAELSVYIDLAHRGRGVGKRLYAALIALLRAQGVRSIYALVTAGNPASEALHYASGFRLTGVQSSAGFKAGGWHDMQYFELCLGPYDAIPAPPVPLRDLPAQAVAAVLAAEK